ncbi:MAG: rhomboid family intramembrane serine protease, partial [Actinomycetota bacterium]
LNVSCSPPACFPGKSVYLSLFSSMFLHGGIVHLLGNMLFLWVFGNNIEDNLGRLRFVLFYFTTGILASLAHVAANGNSVIPTVGASGAIAGLLGAYILLFPRARITTIVPIFFFLQFLKLPAVVVLGLWFGYQFLFGVGQQVGAAGVAWLAHVGGFISGVALIYLFGGRRPARPAFPGYEPYRP